MPPICPSSLLFLSKWLLPPQLLKLKSETLPEGSLPAPPHPPGLLCIPWVLIANSIIAPAGAFCLSDLPNPQ